MAERVAPLLSADQKEGADAARDQMVRKLADQVAALQAENRRRKKHSAPPPDEDPPSRTRPSAASSTMGHDTQDTSRMIAELLPKAVAADSATKRRRLDGPSAAPQDVEEVDDEVDAVLPATRLRNKAKGSVAASGVPKDLPEEVDPDLHSRFFTWLGTSSTLRNVIQIGKWTFGMATTR